MQVQQQEQQQQQQQKKKQILFGNDKQRGMAKRGYRPDVGLIYTGAAVAVESRAMIVMTIAAPDWSMHA